MKTVKVTFYKCIQDSQDYGSDDEHMVSRIFFILETDAKADKGYVDIKQCVGSSYESGPIEVCPPEGSRGPFNYQAFRNGVEDYYRSLVGANGRGIRISGGSNMRNNTFLQSKTIEFQVREADLAW